MANHSETTTEKILMDMWQTNRNGDKEFSGGKENWAAAVAQASACCLFFPDVEEEMVADEERSCYNCRYRRWTEESFVCKSPSHGNN